ncbi:UDP-N-acetylmuramoyl-L-alanine--D-glutamate ligase [Shewanella intestini]|uniref:UDP-N-acetylmuramoylalanine--D-glutamate ligase n=1 Tax=Shewanella intestini TaxID=2017544 RepID=A0ABS5I5E1_9GAMM|nr:MULTISPECIES: UDP-N-acetylmuramoyl-L-alanine--D-glutamate ligase [Shewanella]MBR9729048.1 UDP-N-acetylmuramoyl-L-alanine--D-glutamate ligase [Shewanella intestini]MRG37124.1 UDP-N-acetylmuramoyl-L-alanine--D-glutamate ligase [Shewanella sp. XMDDZSB0408]
MQNGHTHIVLGLGATGLSVVRYLVSQGIKPLVMDTRRTPPGASELANEFHDIELICGGFDCRGLVQATQIIVSPGIALDTPEVRAVLDMGIEVIGDIELFARAVAHRKPCVIGITGSNGKSTVTTLVRDMLVHGGKKAVMGGNIGVPALDLLHADVDYYVLELSSFQLETTSSLNCIAATCLNISEDHMDRYSDINAYREAKLRLYQQTRFLMFNGDDALTEPFEPMNQNTFSLSVPEHDEWGVADGKVFHGSSQIMALDDISLIGSHNHANVIAAMALVDACDIDKQVMIDIAKDFKGLSHRCELVAEKNGVLYINDSKATNVGATVAAIEGFNDHLGDIYLIVGGDGKDADFAPLIPALNKVSQVIALGKDGDKLAALKEGAIKVNTMSEAVNVATAEAMSGDIVMLSPACASLDMYANFMARGDDFIQCVEQITDGQS